MIEPGYFWFCVFCLAMGTIAIRVSIIAIAGRVQISARTRELFTFIPAAILPAFVAPAAFFHQGTVEWALGKERLLVMMATVVLCTFYRSTLVTILFGLAALYGLTHFT